MRSPHSWTFSAGPPSGLSSIPRTPRFAFPFPWPRLRAEGLNELLAKHNHFWPDHVCPGLSYFHSLSLPSNGAAHSSTELNRPIRSHVAFHVSGSASRRSWATGASCRSSSRSPRPEALEAPLAAAVEAAPEAEPWRLCVPGPGRDPPPEAPGGRRRSCSAEAFDKAFLHVSAKRTWCGQIGGNRTPESASPCLAPKAVLPPRRRWRRRARWPLRPEGICTKALRN